MTVGLLRVVLRIPGSASLKDKRRVLLRLKDAARKRYNISFTEIDDKDKWQKAILAIAQVADRRIQVDRTLANVVDFISSFDSIEILDYEVQLL
jgi:hypothetical protein